MGLYENLCIDYNYIPITETNMLPSFQSGSYINGEIFIKQSLSETTKAEVLSEEIAHHKLTWGNITDQTVFNHRKFEGYARRHAMEQVVSLSSIIEVSKHNCHNLYEIADFFEVSEDFVQQSIINLKKKYGLSTLYDDYLIQFEPLRVFEYKNLN